MIIIKRQEARLSVFSARPSSDVLLDQPLQIQSITRKSSVYRFVHGMSLLPLSIIPNIVPLSFVLSTTRWRQQSSLFSRSSSYHSYKPHGLRSKLHFLIRPSDNLSKCSSKIPQNCRRTSFNVSKR